MVMSCVRITKETKQNIYLPSMKLRSEPRVVSQGGDLVTRNLLYESES